MSLQCRELLEASLLTWHSSGQWSLSVLQSPLPGQDGGAAEALPHWMWALTTVSPRPTLGAQEGLQESRLGLPRERREGPAWPASGCSSDHKATDQRPGLASDSADSGVSGSRIENKLRTDSILCLTRKEKWSESSCSQDRKQMN